MAKETNIQSMDTKTNTASTPRNSLVNSLNVSSYSFLSSKLIIALVVVILLGVGTGYIFSKVGSTNNTAVTKESITISSDSKEVVGSADTKTFKDTATGTLKAGGIDGEGAYHLVRPGGDSQNVYLTSSIVDLSTYIGRKVKVWGQTQKAEKAGWLMDAGRVEILK